MFKILHTSSLACICLAEICLTLNYSVKPRMCIANKGVGRAEFCARLPGRLLTTRHTVDKDVKREQNSLPDCRKV